MSAINFRPLYDRIVIEYTEESNISAGGLVIPEAAREKSQMAVVVALGTNDNFNVKVGDSVLVGKYAGDPIKLDGKEYTTVHESDVLGIWEA